MQLQTRYIERGTGGRLRLTITPIAILATAGLAGCLADDIDVEDEGLSAGVPTYTISGQANGIAEGDLQMTLNGDETITLSNDGSFTFSTQLEQGEDYTITVDGHPDHSYCDLSNAQGSMPADHVDNVTADCEVLTIGATNKNQSVELNWGRAGDVDIAYSTDSNCDWVNASSCPNGGKISNTSGGGLTVDESDGLNMNELYSFALMVGDQTSRPAQGTLSPFELSGNVHDTLITDDTVYAGGNFLLHGAPSSGFASYRDDTSEARLTGAILSSLNPVIVFDSVADPNGGRFVAGAIDSINGETVNHVVRLNEDGSLDTSWSANISGSGVVSLAVDESRDRLFIGGDFSSVNGNSDYENLAALNLDGSLDTTFASESPDGIVWSMETSDDHLYLGGLFAQVGSESRTAAAALDIEDGTLSADFTPEPDGAIYAILHDQDQVYLGGTFSNMDGSAQPRIAKVDDTDGSLDPAFAPEPDGTVRTMELIDGQLVLAGLFDNVDGTPRTAIAAVDPQSGDLSNDWDISIEGTIITLSADDDNVYFGGNITEAEGATRYDAIRVDRDTQDLDPDWAPRIDSDGIWHLDKGEHIFIGGNFRGAEGETVNNLAAFDVSTGELVSWDAGTDSAVRSLATDTNQLFVGGDFSEVYSGGDNASREHAAAFDLSDATITNWDPQPDDTVRALELNHTMDRVFMGGSFQDVRGDTRNRLAAVDSNNGATYATGDPDFDGTVRTLSYFDNNTALIVGGSFRNANGGATMERYAFFNDPTDFTTATSGSTFNSTVYATYVDPSEGDNHFVGGTFTEVNGSAQEYVAWLPNGSNVHTSSPVADGTVYTIDWAKSEDRLVFGGRFSSFDGDTRDRVAIMDFEGSSISNATSPEADNIVRSVSQTADTIVIAGDFLTVDSERSPGLIALNSNDLSPAWPTSNTMPVSNPVHDTGTGSDDDSKSSPLLNEVEGLRNKD